MLVLRTLGGLSLDNGGRPIVGAMNHRGRLAILAVIAVARERGVSRDRLLAMFWPESDTERARGSLKQATFQLRRDATEPELLLGTTEMRFNPDVIRSDVRAFEDALDARNVEEAVRLYGGPFLEGIHLHDAREFERWADAERDRLTARYRRGLEQLARSCAERGQLPEAVEYWRTLASSNPLSASVTLSLMSALVDVGDTTAALRHARIYAELVQQELDAPPDPAVEELVLKIRRQSGAERPFLPPSVTSIAAVAAGDEIPSQPSQPAAGTGRLADSGFRRNALAGAALVVLGAAVLGWNRIRDDRDTTHVVVVVKPDPSSGHSDGFLDALLRERLTDGVVSTNLTSSTPASRAHAPAAPNRFTVQANYAIDGDSILLSARLVPDEANVPSTPIVPVHAARTRTREAVEVLRTRMMASLASRLDPKLAMWAYASVLPASFEGVRELRLGIDAFAAGEPDSMALKHFLAASALDSASATAHVWMAYVTGTRESWAAADTRLSELERSGSRVGPWDRALLDVLLARNRGDLVTAYDAGLRLLNLVPGSEWGETLAWDAFSVGRAGEAVRILRALDPDRGWLDGFDWYWFKLGQSYHLLGDYRNELLSMREALRREPNNRLFIQQELRALAALGRVKEVEDRCSSTLALRPPERWGDFGTCDQGVVELWAHGHQREAVSLADWNVARYAVKPDRTESQRAVDIADTYMDVRNYAAAGRALQALRSEHPTDPEYYLMLAQLDAIGRNRGGVEKNLGVLDSLVRANGHGVSEADASFRRATLAALLGDKVEAMNWLNRSFQQGFRLRSALHWHFAFDKLRGYPAFELLTQSVDRP